ncbi:MAG: ABC transporter permease [Pseudomonadota bacterium]
MPDDAPQPHARAAQPPRGAPAHQGGRTPQTPSRPPPAEAAPPQRPADPHRSPQPANQSTVAAERTPRRRPQLVDAPDQDVVVENGPLVAQNTVAARGLTSLIAIMAFLSALLLGAAMVVDRAANAWGAKALEEVSVTLLPKEDAPMGPRLAAVEAALTATDGLTTVTIIDNEQSQALLAPWFGEGTDLSLLPVPRIVVAERSGPFDRDGLQEALSTIEGAMLDDHEGWSERLSSMARAVLLGVVGILGLMLVATTIAVVFATRATIAANSATIEVLYVLGAEDRFIERAFRRRFVLIGLRGALLGVAIAAVPFAALEIYSLLGGVGASAQADALFGRPRIGAVGFAALFAIAGLIALTVGLTTRKAVRHQLKELNP